VPIHGIKIHSLSERECIEHIITAIGQGHSGWVHTINLDILRVLVKNAEYAELCKGTTLAVADGMPLIWASRLMGRPLPERIAGSDLVSTLSGAAAQAGFSVFLLGGNPGTAEKAGSVLQDHYPGLRIAGAYCPAFGFEDKPEIMEEIRQLVLNAAPDIVYVALGVPRQERIIGWLRPEFSRTWWMGVGISFSFITGDVPRAPRWMQKVGLEWVHRMIQEPRRLAWRYLVEDIPFVVQLLVKAAFGGKKTDSN
jgi:N-acetylglucosaminyldiphosphoundecaprenol N-acetyl-beta-D-mannosaminyltransferase